MSTLRDKYGDASDDRVHVSLLIISHLMVQTLQRYFMDSDGVAVRFDVVMFSYSWIVYLAINCTLATDRKRTNNTQ